MEFESDGLRISFLDILPVGRDLGEPILLLHGFASSARVNWVDTGWTKLLSEVGRRVIAPDQRGHGASDKPHDPARYAAGIMAADAGRLLQHLGVARADVLGYSMGARVAAFLALSEPSCVRSVIFGGLGSHLVDAAGLPDGIAEAMETEAPESLADPAQRMFRRFAEAGGNDLRALAACIRGTRQTLSEAEIGAIACPALVAVGTNDTIAGNARRLAGMLQRGEALDIPGRDHNPAVGDRVFKTGALAFLAGRP